MEPIAIIKIVLLLVGGLVVLDHTPGIDIFKDDRGDYKALVKCEAKSEGLARKCQDTVRSCRVTLHELKRQKKETKKLEKENRKLIKALEVARLDSGRSNRGAARSGRLRNGEDDGAREESWKRIYPWRW